MIDPDSASTCRLRAPASITRVPARLYFPSSETVAYFAGMSLPWVFCADRSALLHERHFSPRKSLLQNAHRLNDIPGTSCRGDMTWVCPSCRARAASAWPQAESGSCLMPGIPRGSRGFSRAGRGHQRLKGALRHGLTRGRTKEKRAASRGAFMLAERDQMPSIFIALAVCRRFLCLPALCKGFTIGAELLTSAICCADSFGLFSSPRRSSSCPRGSEGQRGGTGEHERAKTMLQNDLHRFS